MKSSQYYLNLCRRVRALDRKASEHYIGQGDYDNYETALGKAVENLFLKLQSKEKEKSVPKTIKVRAKASHEKSLLQAMLKNYLRHAL